MNIYSHTIQSAGLSPNAHTSGTKALYALCTALATLDSEAPLTDPSPAQSVLDRLVELGIDPRSTVMQAMRFDLSHTIAKQRQ
jgi:hypothetical protein